MRVTTKRLVVLAAVLFVMAAGCEREHLRGRAEASADGRTYLVIEDDNGGAADACLWTTASGPLQINRPHPISPGQTKMQRDRHEFSAVEMMRIYS